EAAVIGKVFWAEPVSRSLGDVVPPALLALERRGLVSARANSSLASQPEYAFKHALVRDVAYASLPKSRRAKAHAEVGAWIEELAGERVDGFGELIADHFRLAVAGDEAAFPWRPAGREPTAAKAFRQWRRAGASA